MASVISSARAALHTLLSLHEPLSGVQVTFGPPESAEGQEVVALLGIDAADEDQAVIGGPRPREERFIIVVRVKAHDPGGTPASVDARGFALADEVREVVYANQTLSDTLTGGWARVSSMPTEGVLPDEAGGFSIYLTVNIACRSRIF